MKNWLVINCKTIILSGSTIGLLYCMIAVYGRLRFTFNKATLPADVSYELSNLWVESIHAIPALLGLLIFRRRSPSVLVAVLYIVYALLSLYAYLSRTLATDALEAGLPYVLIVLPGIVIISIILLIHLVSSKTA